MTRSICPNRRRIENRATPTSDPNTPPFEIESFSGDVGEELAKLQREFDGEIDVGGPTLAAQFIERGLVDEHRLVVHPVVLGAGTLFFPPGVSRFDLRRTETRAFASGAMYLGYEAVR